MSVSSKLPPGIRGEPAQGLTNGNGAREAWRVFGIMAEFVEATDRLARIRPAVTIFGSARTPVDSPYYALTEAIARKLSDSGFSVIREEWERSHLWQGKAVSLIAGVNQVGGVVLGIDGQGALRHEVNGVEKIYSGGELSLRLRDDS